MLQILRNQISRLQELQNIINAESESAELGHNQSRARIIEAEQEQEKIMQKLKAFGLWFALIK